MPEPEQWITLKGGKGPGQGKHIVLISGDEEYRSEQSMPMLAKLLSTHHGFDTTTLFAINPETGLVNPNVLTHTPGLHLLATADLCILAIRFREWPDEQMAHFDEFVYSGKPLIGLRTTTHGFHYKNNPASPYAHYATDRKAADQPGFGKQVLGEHWAGHHGHHGHESTRAVPNAEHKDHPVLRGVGPIWGPSDVYVAHPPRDATVLLTGHALAGMSPDSPENKDKSTMPVAWLRHPDHPVGTGRKLCSTIGAAVDLADASLRRLLINGAYWCLEMDEKIDAASNVATVGNYRPSHFGVIKEWDEKPARAYFD